MENIRAGRDEEMAERAGFEPAIPLRVYRFSRPAPSTTRPPLRVSRTVGNDTSFPCPSLAPGIPAQVNQAFPNASGFPTPSSLTNRRRAAKFPGQDKHIVCRARLVLPARERHPVLRYRAGTSKSKKLDYAFRPYGGSKWPGEPCSEFP